MDNIIYVPSTQYCLEIIANVVRAIEELLMDNIIYVPST
jgi:hypothetical protein